jgi:hypothetical protein
VVKIEIKNFQSIAHETIEIDGFSALVGRSNIGKSAIVRAIKAALSGSPVDSYVRHDINCPRINGAKSCKCFCSVHIKAEGLDLLWEKGDTINQYTYNKTKYTVVGRGTPDFLTQDFAPVKLGDEKEIIQISDQFKPIFILDKSGTVVADVLSDVAKLNQINVAMRMVEKDRRDASATRKVREEDLAVLKASLLRYDGLDDVVKRVSDLEVLDQQTEKISIQIKQLESFIEALFDVVGRIKSLEGINLITIPDVIPLVNNGTKFIKLEDFIVSLSNKIEAVSLLNGVEIVEITNIESFLALGAAYEKLVQWASAIDLLRASFDRFQKFDVVSIPVLDSLGGVKEIYFKLDSWTAVTHELSQSLIQVKQDLDQVIEEEKSILNEFQNLEMCPTCNRSFAGDHVCLG